MTMLQGKVAIVTGAASGIGRATALLLARHGASVVLADVHEASDVAREIEVAGGCATALKVDVSRDDDCAAMVRRALDAHGRLDMAFNNAGISGPIARTGDLGVNEWRRVLDVNLTGVFNCMVHELRAMEAGGGGAIVNTASVAGLSGAAGTVAYCASKHGVVGLSRTAAQEYAKHGIRVNTLCPGYVATQMTQGVGAVFSDKQAAELIWHTPMRRACEPQEQAEMVLWLLSDKASYVTGAEFIVDGGMNA